MLFFLKTVENMLAYRDVLLFGKQTTNQQQYVYKLHINRQSRQWISWHLSKTFMNKDFPTVCQATVKIYQIK